MLERIKPMRLSSGFSQRALASRIGVSQKSIDNWENGVSEPSALSILKLADIFGCSVDYLWGREDDLGQIVLNSDLTEEEKEILYLFNLCGKKEKISLINYARYLADTEKL